MAAAIGVIVVVAVLIILSGLKVLKEYERAVVFRLGRLTTAGRA
jgi:regulator of protease activity HflC (stomatin/prohibitin superfamily)